MLETRSSVPPSLNTVPATIAGFATLLVFDWACTFADEVAYVWSSPWNLGTILFVLNRYPPFVDTFLSLYILTTTQPPDVCLRSFKTVTWLIVFGVFIAEAILMLRTYAIYDRKRWVLILLSITMACLLIPGTVVVELELQSLSYGIPPSGIYTGCYLDKPASTIIFLAYVLVLASETLVFVLTLIKAIKHLRRSRTPLVINLYRNGLLFYLYTFLISMANVIVPVAAPARFSNWLATPQRVLHSIFCTRILLSLLRDRQAYLQRKRTEQQLGGTNFQFTSILPPSDSDASTVPSALWTPRDEFSSDGEPGEARYYRRGWAVAQSVEDEREGEVIEMGDLAGKDGKREQKRPEDGV